MVADDDYEVHTITKMILKSFAFEEKNLIFIDTYSGKETMEALEKNPDTAVLFLDVVMEETHSGLLVVDYLRKTLNNPMTRIILRTGQPGESPEDKIIRDYDINDYRLKTDLTVQRLNTSLYAALRSYRDIVRLDSNRRGLEKMIKASAEMFTHNSMSEFLNSILIQIATFYQDGLEMVYVREDQKDAIGGFVVVDSEKEFLIQAAKGRYEEYIGKNIAFIDELKDIYRWIEEDRDANSSVTVVDRGLIVKHGGNTNVKNYIFIEEDHKDFKLDLIKLFLANYSMALDNFYLEQLTKKTQVEILYTLGEVIETQFEETAGHLRCVTNLMYAFGEKLGLTLSEVESIRIASALHDVGKIGIPEYILKNPED
jgi:response regulator RpfG family c-di-GMP phosphodiesterase